jgi:dihydroneopterin aldolase
MRIKIENLKCHCLIGLYPKERQRKQPLILEIEYDYELQANPDAENTDGMVDYDALSRRVKEFVNQSRYQLLETLAQAVIELIFENQKIREAKVTIKKPRALKPALVSVIFEKSR